MSHGHDLFEPFANTDPIVVAALVAILVGKVLFLAGVLPIPVGYDRGKVKWLMWCGTGMHAHIVYWHGDVDDEQRVGGFQAIHPTEVSNR